MKKKLPVKQLESKFTSDPAELPVLTADEYSHIKDMRTDTITHFQIWLEIFLALERCVLLAMLALPGCAKENLRNYIWIA